MWRFTLFGTAVLAAGNRRVNSTSVVAPSSSTSQRSSSASASISSPVVPNSSASRDGSSSSSPSFHSSSRSSASISSSMSRPSVPPPVVTISLNVSNSSPTSSKPPVSTSTPVRLSSSANITTSASRSSQISNTSTTKTGPCTGCVLQAYNPVTTFFVENDSINPWTSVVVTETITTQYITYFDGSTIDTILTEAKTMNHTTTVMGEFNETITQTTPHFTIQPTPGVFLTVDAGPTYVIYTSFDGGLDLYTDTTYTFMQYTLQTCAPHPTKLQNWEPTVTEDWNYFIQTYTDKPPKPTANRPQLLPPKLIQHLKQDPDVVKQFRGSDIATCTTRISNNPEFTKVPPLPASSTAAFFKTSAQLPAPEVPTVAPFPSVITGTFISTTYESTSTHVTRQGCLRCQNTDNQIQPPPSQGPNTVNNNVPGPAPTYITNPDNPDDNTKPNKIPEIPDGPDGPNNDQPSQSVTISDSVLPVRPGQPTQNPDRPNDPVQNPPIIVGTYTLTPGETKTINGVPVVVPTSGSGTMLIVDGSTVIVKPAAPTGAPVLTVESKPITANSQGQFIIGTQTLLPNGPAITVNGNTYSLGPSGTVAIINGVTQTLGHAPAPTPPPVLTVNGQPVSATVISGTTLFVLAPGQTLTPGGVLTVSGTTYSMPASASGSVVVINGVTTTLANGPSITAAPALTIDGKTYAPIVKDGTTQYVLGLGTTLKPGDAVTISGTTYNLDPKGTALVVNGQTSSIPRMPASVSASTTATLSSRMAMSTSTSRDAGDLIASGVGESKSSKAEGGSVYRGGVDKWAEGVVIGVAGWLLLLF